MKWIKAILATIEAMVLDQLACPIEPVAEGEIVIAELSDNLKKFYVYREKLMKELDAIIEQHDWIHKAKLANAETCGRIHGQLRILKSELDALSEVFWVEIRRDYTKEIGDASNIGIRTGWKLVTMPEMSEVLGRALQKLEQMAEYQTGGSAPSVN